MRRTGKPKRRPILGGSIQALATAVLVVAIAAAVWIVFMGVMGDPTALLAFGLIPSLFFAPFAESRWFLALFGLAAGAIYVSFTYALIYKWLRAQGERFVVPDAKDVLTSDPRAPVLYLRPFSSEGVVSLAERDLVDSLRSIGPVVAIGKPGDVFPRLGAARLYVSDEDWQDVVGDLIRRARLIILVGGSSQGVMWEVEACFRLSDCRQIIIVLLNRQKDIVKFADAISNRIKIDPAKFSAVNASKSWFPVAPLASRHFSQVISGMITFSSGWAPRYHLVPLQPQITPKHGWSAGIQLCLDRAIEHINEARIHGDEQLVAKPLAPDYLEYYARYFVFMAESVTYLMRFLVLIGGAVLLLALLADG